MPEYQGLWKEKKMKIYSKRLKLLGFLQKINRATKKM